MLYPGRVDMERAYGFVEARILVILENIASIMDLGVCGGLMSPASKV